jgi:hypothetical protein
MRIAAVFLGTEAKEPEIISALIASTAHRIYCSEVLDLA